MKKSIRIATLILSLVLFVTSLVSCGGAKETESEEIKHESNQLESESFDENENPRLAVKDGIPADLSYAKASDNRVTFFVRDDSDIFKYEMDVNEITNDTLWDAIYERNALVENRLGVEITTIAQPGAWGGPHEIWFQTLRNAVNTKTGDYDGANVYTSQGSPLALEGMYYNLLNFPNVDLKKPWWNQNIIEELTIFDTLFYLAGDLAISEIAQGYAFFYNKDMFYELYSTQNIDLYQMVRDGEWTVDKLYEFCAAAWTDNNSSGVIDDGDTIGYTAKYPYAPYDVLLEAMDVHITTQVNGIPTLTFYNERTVEVFEKLQSFHLNNPGVLYSNDARTKTSFAANRVLFQFGTMETGNKLRNVEFEYGVLPIPKFDTAQEEYRTSCNNTASLIVVLSSLPADKTEMVGATLELMAAGSYKTVTPAYYDIVLKSKRASSSEDAEMYDLILNSYSYSFGFIHSTASIAQIGTLFRNFTTDLAQRYESKAQSYDYALEILIDKFDELAFTLYGNN